jgi:hypothetical protein
MATVLVALFLPAALPLILTDYERGRAADDQNMWHLPAIRQFARQLPRPDLRDYLSATTPLYHLLIAAADRWISPDLRVLRLLGALFTAGLLATLGAAVARRAPAWLAIALCLPMVASLYVFGSGAWLLPDNAGWWGVLALMLLAFRHRVDAWTYLGGAVLLLLLVLVRQSHAWAAAPLWVAAWMGSDTGEPPARPAAPAARLAWIVVATVPAAAVVLYFFHLWHGPVPPSIQFFHDPSRAVGKSWNPAVPATVLGVVGVLGIFFLGFARGVRTRRAVMFTLAGAAIGLILGVLPVSTYSHEAGRESGIWNLVPHAPIVGQRSLAIVALSVLGGALLGWWSAALDWRDRVIFLVAWAAFIAAQTVNTTAWQRYYEPFVLMMLALTAVRLERAKWTFSAVIGPLLLAAMLGIVTAFSLR